MPTHAWILTSTSLVMRRWKSLFPPTVLESQIPRLMPAPLPRLLLPLLTSDLLHIAVHVCLFVCLFFFFFYVGLQTLDICDGILNEYPILYSLISFCCLANLSFLVVVPPSELSYLAPWLLGLP